MNIYLKSSNAYMNPRTLRSAFPVTKPLPRNLAPYRKKVDIIAKDVPVLSVTDVGKTSADYQKTINLNTKFVINAILSWVISPPSSLWT